MRKMPPSPYRIALAAALALAYLSAYADEPGGPPAPTGGGNVKHGSSPTESSPPPVAKVTAPVETGREITVVCGEGVTCARNREYFSKAFKKRGKNGAEIFSISDFSGAQAYCEKGNGRLPTIKELAVDFETMVSSGHEQAPNESYTLIRFLGPREEEDQFFQSPKGFTPPPIAGRPYASFFWSGSRDADQASKQVWAINHLTGQAQLLDQDFKEVYVVCIKKSAVTEIPIVHESPIQSETQF